MPRFSTTELLLLTVAVTGVAGTVFAFIIGYRRIRKAQKNYEATKSSPTFADHIQDVRSSIQGLSNRIDNLEAGVETALEASKAVVKHTITIQQQISTISKSHKNLQDQVRVIDDRYRGMLPETEAQAIAPATLINLTPTEHAILKILAQSGPKQTSELHAILGKSREHTARLMNKLFKTGYVEREAQVIPFTYRISEKIKKAIEQSQAKVQPTTQEEKKEGPPPPTA